MRSFANLLRHSLTASIGATLSGVVSTRRKINPRTVARRRFEAILIEPLGGKALAGVSLGIRDSRCVSARLLSTESPLLWIALVAWPLDE